MSALQGDLFAHCQRWRHGRAAYRPAGEVFNTSRASVALLDDDALCKAFTVTHHYSGTYPAARVRVGLFVKAAFQQDKLAGVAVFSVPMTNAAIPAWFPDLQPSEGVELGRFVLLDECEANAETWFQARALRLLKKALPQIQAVVSYCDPMGRTDMDGRTVFPGHLGTIYRAGNAQHLGRSQARVLRLMPNGKVASERALSKIRNDEIGAAYAMRQLQTAGAPHRKLHEPAADYLRRLEQERFFRPLRHPGNQVFGWRLGPHHLRRTGCTST